MIDFCVANAHRFINVDRVVVSYDIACQWSKKLIGRMEAVDPAFEGMYEGAQSVLAKTMEFVVPKFHLFAHKVKCWFSRFNLAYLPGAGQTDGEGCERFWSSANQATNSVREMGPGSVRDMLDSMWDSWNFEKVCGMGESLSVAVESSDADKDTGNLLLKRLILALAEAKRHAAEYNALRQSLHDEDPERVEKWEGDMLAWESGGRKEGKCPYEIKMPGEWLCSLEGYAHADGRIQTCL